MSIPAPLPSSPFSSPALAFAGQSISSAAEALREIGEDAVWTLSSAKPGNGVEHLRDGSIESFWQSDGPQPHHVTIQFHKLTEVSEVWVCSVFKTDESYTPSQISIKIGSGPQDLREIQVADMREPDGWVRIPLCNYSDPNLGYRKTAHLALKDRNFGGALDFIRTFIVQISILTNHQNGRDSHLRQVRIYGPRKKAEFSLIGPIVTPVTNAVNLFRSVR